MASSVFQSSSASDEMRRGAFRLWLCFSVPFTWCFFSLFLVFYERFHFSVGRCKWAG